MDSFSLRTKIHFSGTPDEDGDLCVTSQNATIFMTRKEMRQLRDHLDAVLKLETGQDITVGTKVRILQTSHDDLRGQVGTVQYIMPSGNLQVGVGAASMITTTSSVEVVK